MGVLTQSSINFDRTHRSHGKFNTLFSNDVSYKAANLNIFGPFVSEIFLKILLGALGIWLSIDIFLYQVHVSSLDIMVNELQVSFALTSIAGPKPTRRTKADGKATTTPCRLRTYNIEEI